MPAESRDSQASRLFRDTFAIFKGGLSRVNKTDTSTANWGDSLEEPCEGNLQARFCEGAGSVIIKMWLPALLDWRISEPTSRAASQSAGGGYCGKQHKRGMGAQRSEVGLGNTRAWEQKDEH